MDTSKQTASRTEHDSMGDVLVPVDRLWGAQTQRSLENFKIGKGIETMPAEILHAFGILKKAAALANHALLPEKMTEKKLNALTLVGEGDNAVNEAHVWFNTFNTTGNMARELLIFIGEEVSYVNDKGETKALTEADLAAALTGFVVPFKETDKKQSPAGMYTNWLDMLK